MPTSQWSLDNPTIGVNVKRATYDILDARRRAEGKTWAALLLGDLEQRDSELTSARAEGQAAERKRSDREQAATQREHKAELAAAAEQAQVHEQAAVAQAEAQGRAQADPALRAEMEQARKEAESWQAGSVILLRYFEERGTMLLNQAEPSVRATLSRWLDAQEAAIRAELGWQADWLPLPRQVAAEIATAHGGRAESRTGSGQRTDRGTQAHPRH